MFCEVTPESYTTNTTGTRDPTTLAGSSLPRLTKSKTPTRVAKSKPSGRRRAGKKAGGVVEAVAPTPSTPPPTTTRLGRDIRKPVRYT